MRSEYRKHSGKDGETNKPSIEQKNRLRLGVEFLGRRWGEVSIPVRLIRRSHERRNSMPVDTQSEGTTETVPPHFAEAMSFIKTTATKDEQSAAVGQAFDTFVDTLIAAHPETFTNEKGTITAESHINMLGLQIPLQDGTTISVAINTHIWNGEQRRSTSLQHITQAGGGGEEYSYYHYGNKSVIRGYISEEELEISRRIIDARKQVAGEDVVMSAALGLIEIEKDKQNTQFAAEMGMPNEYLIGDEELEGLIRLVTLAKSKKTS